MNFGALKKGVEVSDKLYFWQNSYYVNQKALSLVVQPTYLKLKSHLTS